MFFLPKPRLVIVGPLDKRRTCRVDGWSDGEGRRSVFFDVAHPSLSGIQIHNTSAVLPSVIPMVSPQYLNRYIDFPRRLRVYGPRWRTITIEHGSTHMVYVHRPTTGSVAGRRSAPGSLWISLVWIPRGGNLCPLSFNGHASRLVSSVFSL